MLAFLQSGPSLLIDVAILGFVLVFAVATLYYLIRRPEGVTFARAMSTGWVWLLAYLIAFAWGIS